MQQYNIYSRVSMLLLTVKFEYKLSNFDVTTFMFFK